MRIRTLFLTTLNRLCYLGRHVRVGSAHRARGRRTEPAGPGRDDIERGAGDLSYLASQYLLYRQDQGRTLWWARFTSFSDDVSHLSPADAEGATLAASIRANREQLQTVFSEVSLAVQARSAGQGAAAPDSAFLQLSWSRIEAVDQAMLLDASRLAGQLRAEADGWQGTSTVLGFALLALFAAYVMANYLMIYRRTLRSLDKLRAGVEIVGAGRLEHTIPEKGRDEIAELTRASTAWRRT